MIESEATQKEEEKTIPFYPDHVRNEVIVALGVIVLAVIVGILALWMPVGQGEPADPMNTPAHTKPEWYFLFLYQILKYVPKTVGVIMPILGLTILILWPFFDRRQDTLRARRVRIIAATLAIIAIIVLTLLGEIG